MEVLQGSVGAIGASAGNWNRFSDFIRPQGFRALERRAASPLHSVARPSADHSFLQARFDYHHAALRFITGVRPVNNVRDLAYPTQNGERRARGMLQTAPLARQVPSRTHPYARVSLTRCVPFS